MKKKKKCTYTRDEGQWHFFILFFYWTRKVFEKRNVICIIVSDCHANFYYFIFILCRKNKEFLSIFLVGFYYQEKSVKGKSRVVGVLLHFQGKDVIEGFIWNEFRRQGCLPKYRIYRNPILLLGIAVMFTYRETSY